MKKLLVCCWFLLVAFGSTRWSPCADGPAKPLSTGYLDSDLPSWVRLSGEVRWRSETLDGVQFKGTSNAYLLQRLRLNLDLTPRPWLRIAVQTQDARVFFTNVSPVPSSQKDPIDLRLGYLQVGNAESGPVTLRAGRQGLEFGEGRLLADPNWSNVGRSFDAVRLRVDAFTAVSDKIFIDGLATPTPGEHFDGAYASLERVVPKAVIEPYLFWKMEHKVKGELVKSGNLDEKTAGVRWVGEAPLRLDYGTESAFQRGSYATEPISAWATHFVLRYSFRDRSHAPKVWVEFNRGSGDGNPKDGVHGAFDTLFPSSHDKFGVADQFCWTNLTHVRGGFQWKAASKLTLGVAENWFWLSSRHDGIYASGKVAVASKATGGTFIGQEPDFQAKWKVTPRTQVDFAAGHIFAGRFLKTTDHSGFNSMVVGVTQGF
jgi:hypothetical protein